MPDGGVVTSPAATSRATASRFRRSVSRRVSRSAYASMKKIRTTVMNTATTITDPSFERIVGSFSSGRIATAATP
jgi:hypothetical protein